MASANGLMVAVRLVKGTAGAFLHKPERMQPPADRKATGLDDTPPSLPSRRR